MATVSKRDLVLRIAGRVGQSKAVTGDIIQSFMDEVICELAAGNRLEFREFGIFDVKMRSARKARNPQNGDAIQVPERTVVRFKAGRKMKTLVSGADASVGASTDGAVESAAK